MRCPVCEGKTKVTDSRNRPDNRTYRRRVCMDCGEPISTWEFNSVNFLDMCERHFDEEMVDRIADMIDKEFQRSWHLKEQLLS